MDLENELKELKKEKDNVIEDEPEEDNFYGFFSKRVKEKKKKKKEKKQKSVSAELDKMFEDIEAFSPVAAMDDEISGIMEISKEIKKATKKKNGKFEFDSDKFMNGEGTKRKKHKDLVKKYMEMFKDEEALVLALLKEADKDTKVIRDAFFSLTKNSTVRGVMGKVATDFASALVSANSHRLSIIKQLTDIKKTANDLAFKEESKRKDTDENALDQESLGTMALRSLFSQNNKDFNNEIRNQTALTEEEFNRLESEAKRDSEIYSINEDFDTDSAIDKDGNTREMSVTSRSSVNFDPDMENHLNDLNIQYKDDPIYGRSSAGDNLIMNESRGVKIKVRRWSDEDTGKYEYDFVAVDKDGYEVPDYELPNKNMLKMTWNDESGIAKDNRGRTYEIINY